MKQGVKRLVLAGALVSSAAAAIWDGGDGGKDPLQTRRPVAAEKGAARSTAQPAPRPVVPELDLGSFSRPAAGEEVSDAFETRSWLPPPPPTRAEPPSVPPFPLTYVGKIIDAGTVVVFLVNKQEKSYVVRAGDKIDNTYLVEHIDDTRMTLTYLPLNLPQTLAIGAAQ